MNFTLSVIADRPKKKAGYVLLSEGKILVEKINKFSGNNIKENLFNQIILGLRECRSWLSHNDVLYIELLNNKYLKGWLVDNIDSKEYALFLDEIFEVLDSLDCKYKFFFTEKSFAKKYIDDRDYTKLKVSSLDDLMKDFE